MSVSDSSPSKAIGDLRAGGHLVDLDRRLADLGATQHVLQLADPGFLLTLLLAGGVVPAVLPEIALVARGGDLRGDLGATRTRQLVQLGLQLVVGLLGQPDDLLHVLRHRTSLAISTRGRQIS